MVSCILHLYISELQILHTDFGILWHRPLQRSRFNPMWHQEKFSLGTSAFPYHHYSTNGPYFYLIHLQLVLCSLCTALSNETLPYLFFSSLPELFFSTVHIELYLFLHYFQVSKSYWHQQVLDEFLITDCFWNETIYTRPLEHL